ncbi:hypothetical protein [Sediminibacterium sp. TEGAF015]|uniref:hypothetical protein n=1 Tax=Sediminibacterium sp. TEGAF015 TaxID=575378 RepID=UPI002207F642|nr:hypothetical protein [Sediminibacterium sp. TEGAF015]BDQ12768.1 hypothetical protein TEGAF0_19850 [Sediminibacterium sp. TEGAF015]
MAKNGVIFLMLGALLVQVFSGYILKADYAINRAIYLQNCVNKDKPALQCKGKCQLTQKMREAEKEQQRAAEKASHQLNLPGGNICHQYSFLQIDFFEIQNAIVYAYEQPPLLRRYFISDIFHPPQLA